jgi:hypothetical protein
VSPADVKAKAKAKTPFLHRIFRKWKEAHHVERQQTDSQTDLYQVEQASATSSTSVLPTTQAVGVEEVTDDEAASWRLYTRAQHASEALDASEPEGPADFDVTILKRIAGVLYANPQLDRKVNDLEKAIDRLHAFSRQSWGQRGHGKLDANPEPEEVATVLSIERFQRAARELYQSYLQLRVETNHQWKLELRVPDHIEVDKKVIGKLAEIGTVHFTVQCQATAGGPILAQEVCVRHVEGALISDVSATPLDTAMSQMLSLASQTVEVWQGFKIEFSQSGSPTLWTRSLRYLLERSRDDEVLQEIFSFERARLAFECTLWMIFLWKTDWFANLCSCGFRAAYFKAKPMLSMIPESGTTATTARREYVFRTQHSKGSSHPCPRAYSSSNKLYLLGILLSELFLSEPIDIEISTTGLRPSNRQRFASNGAIVRRLEQYYAIGKQNPVTAAVDFCFKNAAKADWTRSQQLISQAQIISLIENVLTP